MKSTWNHHPGETFDMLIHASSFFIERLPGPSFILATPWHSQCSMSFTCHRIFKKVSCFSFWFRSILTPPVSTVSSREVFEWFHQTPNSWKWEEFCTNPLLSFVSFDKATVAANYLQLTWNGFLVGNDCIFSKNYCLQPLVSFLPTVLTCFAYSEMVAEPFVGNKTLHTKSKTWAFNLQFACGMPQIQRFMSVSFWSHIYSESISKITSPNPADHPWHPWHPTPFRRFSSDPIRSFFRKLSISASFLSPSL